jgi:hypothetical protein
MAAFFRWLGRLLDWLVGRPRPQPAATRSTPTTGHDPAHAPVPTSGSVSPLDQVGKSTAGGSSEPPPAHLAMAAERRWTLLIYMAGDNGLHFPSEAGWTQLMAEMTGAGYADIAELRRAGTTANVACAVQFDTASEQDRSYRIIINPRGAPPTVHAIPETNSGHPDTLRDFIAWGQRTFPAQHTLVVIWNHGGGWKEDDLYQKFRANGTRRGALFATTSRRLRPRTRENRWIAADDSSMDFLDNRDLQQAFQEAAERTGLPVSVIGMDACLMAMVEVAYQLRDEAHFLVASEEVEPMAGWPYTEILAELARNPFWSPANLAQRIVQLYIQSYPSHVPITQSAIVLENLEPLAQALRRFVDAVEAGWQHGDVSHTLQWARHYVLRFEDSDYADLVDFLSLVRQKAHQLQAGHGPAATGHLRPERSAADQPALAVTAVTAVATAAQAVLNLFQDPARTPILISLAQGEAFQGQAGNPPRAHGLAIYLPDRGLSLYYDQLDFRVSRWGDLIRLLNAM